MAKSGAGDALTRSALIGIGSALAALPVIAVVGFPDVASWPYLLGIGTRPCGLFRADRPRVSPFGLLGHLSAVARRRAALHGFAGDIPVRRIADASRVARPRSAVLRHHRAERGRPARRRTQRPQHGGGGAHGRHHRHLHADRRRRRTCVRRCGALCVDAGRAHRPVHPAAAGGPARSGVPTNRRGVLAQGPRGRRHGHAVLRDGIVGHDESAHRPGGRLARSLGAVRRRDRRGDPEGELRRRAVDRRLRDRDGARSREGRDEASARPTRQARGFMAPSLRKIEGTAR